MDFISNMRKLLVLYFVGYLVLGWSVVGQDAITESIIALLNSSRTQMALPNLIMSSELNSAAQRHSNDMAKNGVLDHVGSDASQFWQRMSDAGYLLTTGAENILLRSDTNAQAVFSQWRNSPSHQANMMNPDYVEIGVAYAQAPDGIYYFTMLLGKREGVNALPLPSPTRVPPTNTTAPPTLTAIPPTSTLTPLPSNTPTATPLIPPTRTLSPLITPVDYTPIPLATSVTDIISPTPELDPDIQLIYDSNALTLINISGRSLDLSQLRFQSDDARMESTVWETEFLTERLNYFSAGDCLQVWSLSFNRLEDVPDACHLRHGWVAVNDNQLFWQDVESFFVVNDGDIIGQCTVADGRCELSLEAYIELLDNESSGISFVNRDIRLIFNQDNLTLLNIRDHQLNLYGLVFQSETGRLRIEEWETEFMSASLGGFPPEDCLMVWTFASDNQPIPIECETRHGWIVVGEGSDFWQGVSRFEVVRDNRVLAGCVVANGYCDLSLEGNLGDSSPTLVPNSATSITASQDNTSTTITGSFDDVTLLYSVDSLTLINTSGQLLDISSVVFESDSGVFSATRWQTDFLSRPLTEFPPNDCLQIWGVNEELQSKPSSCSVRHSWTAVASDVQFWRDTSQFRVRYGAELIGTCSVGAGECRLNLP